MREIEQAGNTPDCPGPEITRGDDENAGGAGPTHPTRARDLPIGQALRLLRTGVGITQTEATRRGGPDFRTISHWETGRKMPSLRLLVQYLETLALDLHDLQSAFDQLAGRGSGFTDRLTAIERRLNILERWRLEATATSMNTQQK